MTVSITRATLGIAAAAVAFGVAAAGRAAAPPVGRLPPGPVTTITTSPSQLVALALPHASKKSGLVWRLARQYDSGVVRQVSEADVGANVVLVYKVLSSGRTSIVFALTRGETSTKAVKAATYTIVSR